MQLSTYFRSQAYNNAWANHRLLTACGQLSGDDLAATRVSFFPTLIATWNHILIVDWFYVSGLEGASLGPAAFDPAIPHPVFADLEREQRAIDRRLIAVCAGLTDASIDADVALDRGSRVQTESAGRVLLHLFQHQIHHRGQIHAMLSGTPVDSPQLDEFFLGDGREQSFRADDFETLGFDETRIWGRDES
jgi:uncharacterized damage-inducible protein DinB